MVQADLDTLEFGRKQVAQLEATLTQLAAREARLPLLVQLPGGSVLTALTLLAAIGEINRFPSAKHLVGYAGLGARIRYGAKMIAIDQTPDEVIIHYQTRSGRFKVSGDYAILTVPFPVLRHVEVLKPFSRLKQRAIRQLHYDASAKIFFQTRSRFWETEDGIFGGGTVTDLAIRNLYYTGSENG